MTKEKPMIACPKCAGLGRVANDRYYGPLLRSKREGAKIGLRQLARHLAVSASYLSDLELGRRHINDEMMQRISDALVVLAGGRQ